MVYYETCTLVFISSPVLWTSNPNSGLGGVVKICFDSGYNRIFKRNGLKSSRSIQCNPTNRIIQNVPFMEQNKKTYFYNFYNSSEFELDVHCFEQLTV